MSDDHTVSLNDKQIIVKCLHHKKRDRCHVQYSQKATHDHEKHNILEKTWLVCHVVLLQNFSPLPLELFYPLFLLFGSFYVPLFQKPAHKT